MVAKKKEGSQSSSESSSSLPSLQRLLCNMDPTEFVSRSQARKAVKYGRLLVLRAEDYKEYQNLSDDISSPSSSNPNNNNTTTSIQNEKNATTSSSLLFNETILTYGRVINASTTLKPNDVVALRSRLPNVYYPQSATKYVDPPPKFSACFSESSSSSPNNNNDDEDDGMVMVNNNAMVLYEDDDIAIVNKPEGIDTIGTKRNDLQSALPFMLHPPLSSLPSSLANNKATTNKAVATRPPPIPSSATIPYLPRPIHRLDRKTSGCVLVAKNEHAMKRFSDKFAKRQITKSYCAVVFGEPKQFPPKRKGGDTKNNNRGSKGGKSDEKSVNGARNGNNGKSKNKNKSNNNQKQQEQEIVIDGISYNTINYPIDGKDALTHWRTVTTHTSPKWGKVSLLHLLPKTGRNHQLRRHLSYCLGTPIVGDTKYDGGGGINRKRARDVDGMYLCSNSVSFRHDMVEVSPVVNEKTGQNEERVVEMELSAGIALPSKFYEVLGLDAEKDKTLLYQGFDAYVRLKGERRMIDHFPGPCF